MDEPSVAALVDHGVITESDDGSVSVGERFADAVAARRETFASLDHDARLEAVTADEAVEGILAAHDDASLLAVFDALGDELPTVEADSRLQFAVFVTQVLDGLPRDDGSPAYFFPLDGGRLPLVLDAFDRVIAYIWREDCPPCDLMREDLGEIAPDLSGVALVSVYGPDWQAFLGEHYDVIGAPTTLFAADGVVDARLTGAHYPEVIREEIEKTRNRD